MTVAITDARGNAAEPGNHATTISYDGTHLFPNEVDRPIITNGVPHKSNRSDVRYDQRYDGRSIFCFESHGSSGSLTDGLTYFSYDPLSRKKAQTNPDTATERWSYLGNSVTYTDPRGISWTRTCDFGGRLVQVFEPGGVRESHEHSAESRHGVKRRLHGA